MAMAKVKNRPGRSRTPPTLPNPLSLCLTDLTQSFNGLGIILKKISSTVLLRSLYLSGHSHIYQIELGPCITHAPVPEIMLF